MSDPLRTTEPAPRTGRGPGETSLPLLTRITQQSMDEDYLHAAERRVLAGGGGS